MRISAKVDYAVRACAELAGGGERPIKAEHIAGAQAIPPYFLGTILSELRIAGIVRSRRGTDGGFRLARPAEQVTVADVIRAVEGPLESLGGGPPGADEWDELGSPLILLRVWRALGASLRAVAEQVTLADLASGRLPPEVDRMADIASAPVTPVGSLRRSG